MDVFKQNWGNRMQLDPVANRILNNYELETEHDHFEGRIKYKLWKKYEKTNERTGKTKRKIKTWRKDVVDTEENRNKIVGYTAFEDVDSKDRELDTWYIKRDSIREIDPYDTYTTYYSQKHYWANTRPQSLYNLHYASIR